MPPRDGVSARGSRPSTPPTTSAAARWRQRSPRREETPPAGSPWRTSPRRGHRGGRRRGAPRRPARQAGARPRTGTLGPRTGGSGRPRRRVHAGRRQLGARRGPARSLQPVATASPAGPAQAAAAGPESACEPPSVDGACAASARPRRSVRRGCLRRCRYSEQNEGGGASARGTPADGSAPSSRTPTAVPSRPPGREAPRLATRVQRPGRPSVPGARGVRRQVLLPGGPSRAPWRTCRPCRWRRSW